jgi:hypothetical protein
MFFRVIRFVVASAVLALSVMGCGPVDEDADDEILPGDPRFIRDPALDVENVSVLGEARSHNMGQNCMNCHQARGPGKGQFTTAGTLFKPSGAPLAGGTVELRSAPNGQGDLILAVDVDLNGNFFTTKALPFPDAALFPFVRGPEMNGSSFMPFPTMSGACNVCHVGSQRLHVH